MNALYLLLTISAVLAQVALPRRWAFLPLIFAASHMGSYEILPELTLARTLVFIGIARAIFGGYFAWPGSSTLDKCFYVFALIALVSTIGHEADEYFVNPFVSRVGMAVNVVGVYFYSRTYLPDLEAFKRYAFVVPLVLIPAALMMAAQKMTGVNYYSLLGTFSDFSLTREGAIRASGAFKHAILAGSAGATALPLVFITWQRRRKFAAAISVAACLTMVITCGSSGPLAAVGVAVFSVFFWPKRIYLRHLLWGLVCFAVFYTIVSGRGPWYLMASIDLVGGSTGWHRAKLMDQGYVYLHEWWLWGTDYTRHWMSSGVRWNPNVIDFTNYYLHLGVTGGLGLMFSLIAIIILSGRSLTARMREMRAVGSSEEIVLWFAGVSLATHAISFFSISYFDQMFIFFYLLIGAIPGIVKTPIAAASPVWSAPAQPNHTPDFAPS